MSTAYPPDQLANGYSPTHTSYTNGHAHSEPMDGRQSEYPQSDHSASAQYPQSQDVKYNPSATPTQDYGLSHSPTRSSQYPDYMQRPAYQDSAQRYSSSGAQGSTPGNMAQQPSPSTPLNGGHALHSHGAADAHSDPAIPVDPSIAAPTQGYPQHHYAPYPAPHDAPHYQPAPGMYPQHQYGAPYPGSHGMPYGHVPPSMSSPTQMVPGGARPPGVGTHQQKRPRRRYEEIERMYKCGWNGCEKAYGTLNHLNAHVTMQSHGAKRTPEEFKEIRKEWKQRKKDEEAARKADDERQRGQHHPGSGQVEGHSSVDPSQSPAVRQLPPIGYQPASGQVPGQYAQQVDGMPQYQGGQMGNFYPQSPYGPNNAMYHSNENGSSGSGHSPT